MPMGILKMTREAERGPRLRFGLALWLAGTMCAVATTMIVMPQLSQQMALPAPVWVILIASSAQSGLLMALAVWAGVRLAPTVGLDAPAFRAAVTGRSIRQAIRPQLIPGMIAGLLGGALLFAVWRYPPAALADIQTKFAPPLFVRILYGGITEELLLRWGLMTTLVWLAWRFLQGRSGAVRPVLVWLAILVSALVFGVGHLPLAAVLVGTLDGHIVSFVIGANTAFGLLFGFLYWRYGLESAMIAHAVTHLVGYLANLS
jgi:membrane protease YdiL (CAAX protease family)